MRSSTDVRTIECQTRTSTVKQCAKCGAVYGAEEATTVWICHDGCEKRFNCAFLCRVSGPSQISTTINAACRHIHMYIRLIIGSL